jgi:hypothetical protein
VDGGAKGVPSRDVSSQLPDQGARPDSLSQREAGSGAVLRQVETGPLAAMRRRWRSGGATVTWVTGVSVGFVGLVTWLSPVTERAGFAAAAAAIAGLAVVTWQSVIAGRAAVAAEHGLATATRALDEAERGRLDQQGPQSWATIGDPTWPPRLLSASGGFPQPAPPGTEFALPGSAQAPLILQAEGAISNDGKNTVLVTFSGGFRFRNCDPPIAGADWCPVTATSRQCAMAPGERIKFQVEGQLSVEQWVAEREPADVPAVTAEIILDDMLDNGVIDTWTIELSGRPMEPVPDKTAVFRFPQIVRLGQRPPVHARMLPRRRTYWRSKEQGVRLTSS